MFVLINSGFLLGALPWVLFLPSLFLMLELWKLTLADVSRASGSLNVCLHSFVASWMSSRCTVGGILVGWPLLEQFTAVLRFLYLEIMVLLVVCWRLINVTWKNCMLHAKIKEIKNGADTFSQHCRATLDFNLSHTMLRISLYNLTVPTTMLVALVCIYFFLFCTCFCFFLFVSFSSSHFSLFTFFFFPGCCSGCTTVALKARELC